MMFGYGHNMNGWGYGVMALIMLVLLALLVFVVIGVALLLRKPALTRADHSTEDGPEQVLATRFARGEIDQDEYTSRQATLRARTHP